MHFLRDLQASGSQHFPVSESSSSFFPSLATVEIRPGLSARHLALSALGTFLDAVQLVPPVALEGLRPFMQGANLLRVRAVELVPPIAPHMHQTHVAQHAQML